METWLFVFLLCSLNKLTVKVDVNWDVVNFKNDYDFSKELRTNHTKQAKFYSDFIR